MALVFATYENEWKLHEWVLTIACRLLDDGLPPLQDVMDGIDWNREHISISTEVGK
jgi:hypothetical protein